MDGTDRYDGPALLAARGVHRGFFGNPVLKGVDIALRPAASMRCSAKTARANRR